MFVAASASLQWSDGHLTPFDPGKLKLKRHDAAFGTRFDRCINSQVIESQWVINTTVSKKSKMVSRSQGYKHLEIFDEFTGIEYLFSIKVWNVFNAPGALFISSLFTRWQRTLASLCIPCFRRRRRLVFHFSRSWSAEDDGKSALLPSSNLI